MKLSLSFASSVNASTLQQVVTAAGANTTISIGSAQAVNITSLLAAINAAGNTKNLNVSFDGDQQTGSNLQQALAAAGTNTTISINTAQAVNITTLLSLINSAGNAKKLSADFNGAQLSGNNLQQAVAAAGTNTKISVNTAQAVNITTLLNVISAAGNTKQFSADFNGAALTGNNLQQAITAAGTNVSISINTAQAVNITTLLAAFSAAGATKKVSAAFNGAQLTGTNLQQAVTASGANTSVSVNSAQAVNITTLLGVISAAGNTKKFSADFNGAQQTANNLQQAVAAIGTNSSISVNTAQAVNIASLLSVFSTAGATKKFSATFNGAQLTANNLQQAVSAAGANSSVGVVSAESVPLSTLLAIVAAAG